MRRAAQGKRPVGDVARDRLVHLGLVGLHNGDASAGGRGGQHGGPAVLVDDRAQHVVLDDQVEPGLFQPGHVELGDVEALIKLAARGPAGHPGHVVGLLEVVQLVARRRRRVHAGRLERGHEPTEQRVRGVPAPAQTTAVFPHQVVQADTRGLADGVDQVVGHARRVRFADVEQAGEHGRQVRGRQIGAAQLAHHLHTRHLVVRQRVPHLPMQCGGQVGPPAVDLVDHQQAGRGEGTGHVVRAPAQPHPVGSGQHQRPRPRTDGQHLAEHRQRQRRRRDAERGRAPTQGLPLPGVEMPRARHAQVVREPVGRFGWGRSLAEEKVGTGRHLGQPLAPVQQVRLPARGVPALGERDRAVPHRQRRLGQPRAGLAVEQQPLPEQQLRAVRVDRRAIEAQVRGAGAAVTHDLQRERRERTRRVPAVRKPSARLRAKHGHGAVVHHRDLFGDIRPNPLPRALPDHQPQRVVVGDEPPPRRDQPVGVQLGQPELAVVVASDRVRSELDVLADDVGFLDRGERERLVPLGWLRHQWPRPAPRRVADQPRQVGDGLAAHEVRERDLPAELGFEIEQQPGRGERGQPEIRQPAAGLRVRVVGHEAAHQPHRSADRVRELVGHRHSRHHVHRPRSG